MKFCKKISENGRKIKLSRSLTVILLFVTGNSYSINVSENFTFGDSGYFVSDSSLTFEIIKEVNLWSAFSYIKSSSSTAPTFSIAGGAGASFSQSIYGNAAYSYYKGLDTYGSTTLSACLSFDISFSDDINVMLNLSYSGSRHFKTISKRAEYLFQSSLVPAVYFVISDTTLKVSYSAYWYDRDLFKIQENLYEYLYLTPDTRLGSVLSLISGFPDKSITLGISQYLFEAINLSFDYSKTTVVLSKADISYSYLFGATYYISKDISIKGSYNLISDSSNNKSSYYSAGINFYL